MSPSLRYGYGTNGFADHRLGDALELLADLGYDGVALTLDVRHLDPFAEDVDRNVKELTTCLADLDLAVVIETGARFLLDPRRKHQPTLVSAAGRDRRLDYLRRAIDIAAELGAETMSFWSGTPEPAADPDLVWHRLVAGCRELLDLGARRGVQVALEPEPGMLIDRLDAFDRLVDALDGDGRMGLTLDLGHCRCLEDDPVAACIQRSADRLVNVQIEDMRRGVHEHLPFGDGEIDFPPVLRALSDVGYAGLVSVELPRHSHAAPQLAASSLDFLRAAETPA